MKRSRGIAIIDSRLDFPPVEEARPDGLLAVGGDLSPERLLLAYQSGIFPWSSDPITWWSPNPRSILPVGGLHVSRSLARTLRRQIWQYTFDTAFESVVRACASPAPGREETWIEEAIIRAYTALHHRGHAHSIEVWQDRTLVGGIYGVALGGFFAGESMFHRADDASKAALVVLMEHLEKLGFSLFDTQVASPLTRQMGAVDIPRPEYLVRLQQALTANVAFRA
ncbi:MAG: leucyl/phenylalanyl-tRNA--protein transferase [Candidatus Methylacidiphilales bacterium]|nr:leucyl/phenylalanyl-tRNA--protein transferase [Candidatus Methylacidiphilales bacterium]